MEITEENLDTGARGIPLGTCVTSEVMPNEGLRYCDIPIAQLADRDPVEVIYLLYYGELGSKEQVKKFAQNLAERAFCKPDTIRFIEALPRAGHPMDVFAAALLIAGMFEGTDDYSEDCLNVIAKLPQIVATVINSHAGFGPTPAPKPELGYMENFVHMLKFPGERRPELIQVMRMFDVTHFDHDGGNLSTFTGKAVASGRQHMWGSLAAAMSALAGPLHGRANQECLEFVKSVLDAVPSPTPEAVEQFVRNCDTIFGFGHAVLRIEDPRAAIFYKYAESHFANDPLIKTALILRTVGTKVLKERGKAQNPYPNVDAITGSVLTAAGFNYPDYYTVLFGLSRCVGISIQIAYERSSRAGKGVPIFRPTYIYKSRK